MKPGIYTDISIDDYHNDKEWLSSSNLRIALDSIRHYWFSKNEEEEKKSHFDFGNAFECALLEPDLFDQKVAIYDDREILEELAKNRPEIKSYGNTTEYRNWKKDFYSTNADKYIIERTGAESFETIEHMLDACYRDAVIQKLIKGAEYQYSIFWQDPETGLNLKTRPDVCRINRNVVIDVKTARNGSPDGFSRSIKDHKLHIQAIMQIDGILSSGLMPSVDKYYWLVCEKNAPFNATLYEFTEWQQERSYEEYRHLLKSVKEAEENNLWTGYGGWSDNKWGILEAPIKPWTFKEYSYEL